MSNDKQYMRYAKCIGHYLESAEILFVPVPVASESEWREKTIGTLKALQEKNGNTLVPGHERLLSELERMSREEGGQQ